MKKRQCQDCTYWDRGTADRFPIKNIDTKWGWCNNDVVFPVKHDAHGLVTKEDFFCNGFKTKEILNQAGK